MIHYSKALSEKEVELIQHNVFNGLYNVWELNRIFETIHIQRGVLHDLFNLFHAEPSRSVCATDAIPNSQLRHFKELVSMEDGL